MSTDDLTFADFLSELSNEYKGEKIFWLKLLLSNHCSGALLGRDDIPALELFNELEERGYISYEPLDVEILVNIAEETNQEKALDVIEKFKNEQVNKKVDNFTKGEPITPFRKNLYNALRKDSKKVTDIAPAYKLGHVQYKNIWDFVLELEKNKLLEDTKESKERFARQLNKDAADILLGKSSGVDEQEQPKASTSLSDETMERVQIAHIEVQDTSTPQSKGLNKDDLYDFFVVSDDVEWEKRAIKELQKLRSDVTCLSQTDWNPSLFWAANLSKLSKICKMVLVGFTSNPMTKYSEYTAQVMFQRWNSTSMEKLKLIIAKINRDAIIPDFLDGVSVSNSSEKDFYRKILNTLREEVIGVIVKTQNSEQEKPVYNSCVTKFPRLRMFFEKRFKVNLRCIGKGSIVFHLAVNDASHLNRLWESYLKEELKKDLAEILEYSASKLLTVIDEHEYQTAIRKLMEKDAISQIVTEVVIPTASTMMITHKPTQSLDLMSSQEVQGTCCQDHPDNTVDRFCTTCTKCVCKKCIMSCYKDHHDMMGMRDAKKAFNTQVTEVIVSTEVVKQELETTFDSIMHDHAEFYFQVNWIQDNIKMYRKKIISKVEEDTQRLLLDLQNVCKQKNDAIKGQIKELELHHLELQSLKRSSEKMMNRPEKAKTLDDFKPDIEAVKQNVNEMNSRYFSFRENNLKPNVTFNTDLDDALTKGLGEITSIDNRFIIEKDDRSITVSKGQTFEVKAEGLDESDTCKVAAITPSGEQTATEVEHIESGENRIKGRCDKEGDWKMDVIAGVEHFKGSQVDITVSKGQTFEVKAEGLDESDTCKVAAITPSGEQTATEVEHIESGENRIKGRCDKEGDWKMDVIAGVEHFKGSPVDITVSKGQTFEVKADSLDESDTCKVAATLITPSGEQTATEVEHIESGEYRIKGRCDKEGDWKMDVIAGVAHFKGSPVNIKVEPLGLVRTIAAHTHIGSNVSDVVLDSDGCILVSSYCNELLKFTKSGEFVANIKLAQNTEVYRMHNISNGCIVYSDRQRKVVVMLNNKFEECMQFGKGILKAQNGLTVNNKAQVLYVADTEAQCVFKFNIDDGRLLGKVKIQLVTPIDVTLTKECHLMVTDCVNHRIQMFDADGTFIKTLVSQGEEDGKVMYPCDILTDMNENIIVSSGKKIQLFDKNGIFVKRIDGIDDGIKDSCRICVISNRPRSIAVANHGQSNVKILNY